MCNEADIFAYVRAFLVQHGGQQPPDRSFPFRDRSDHIRRVCQWARRLADGAAEPVDRDALFTAALFHDIGYGDARDGVPHAANSARIFRAWAAEQGLPEDRGAFIEALIAGHSDKERLRQPDTPLELVLLMEADLLDETGALSIVWDCLMEGARERPSYMEAYRHIERMSGKILRQNPMRTAAAQRFWWEKQRLTAQFLARLALDLGLAEE